MRLPTRAPVVEPAKLSAPRPGAVVSLLTAEARLKRALRYHLSQLGFTRTPEGGLAPPDLSKGSYRQLHRAQLRERLNADRSFILRQWSQLRDHFAHGSEVDPSRVAPRLELIQADTWQSDLFRLAALTWCVPVSRGYGRRMRFLVWDDSNGKLVGLMALADPVFNLAVRDEHIGWAADDRKKRLAHVLDAYVLGALPPYTMLLGGKLVAALVCTQEVRDAFARKYSGVRGLISGEVKPATLAMVTTSSVSRPRVSLDTSLRGMMLRQGGGHGQTQERQEVPGARRGAGWS